MKFWLIQRGKWNTNNKKQNEITSLTGRNGLINLDYMGSSEFEWGTIPKAYRRIMAEFEQYSLVQTDIENSNGVPLQLFCRNDRINDITAELKNYIANPYNTKEWVSLENHFKIPKRYNGKIAPIDKVYTNFWWEVENGIDCMFFFGVNDRRNMFLATIANDYNNWWLAKDEEKRQDDIKESFATIY